MWNMPGNVVCEEVEAVVTMPNMVDCVEKEKCEKELKDALEQLSNEDIDLNLDFIFE